MTNIDYHAYNNYIRFLHPAYKVIAVGITIFLVLLLDRPLVSLVALLWMIILTVGFAGIQLKIFSRLLLAEATFLVLTVIGVVISVHEFSGPYYTPGRSHRLATALACA